MSELLRNDVDPVETREWLQALESLLREEGPERARFIIDQLAEQARKAGVDLGGFAANGYGEHSPGSYSLKIGRAHV